MICDSMISFDRYAALAPEVWEKLTAFFRTVSLDSPALGSYELDGQALRVNLVDAKLSPADAGVYEAHRRFIDIHIPLDGSETILCRADSCDLVQEKAYDADCDCVLYKRAPGIEFPLETGYFLMVFPGEPHQPQIGEAGSVRRKIIVKIDIDLLK